MKDLVVKTVLITLAFIFSIILLVFGALALFSPITLADTFDGTGGYSSSIYFYEKQYKKTGDIEDLALLAIKVNQDIDAQLAEQYLGELVSHEKFAEFCAEEEGKELSNREFYYGKYAVALVKNDGFDKALEVAEEFVKANGYTSYNPYSVLIIEQGESFSSEQLDQIQSKILFYSASAEQDINQITYLKSKIN